MACCAICMDDIQTHTNCTTTECGHTFHASCLFRNLFHRLECPMCRAALVSPPEVEGEDEDEESDAEESDDEESVDEEASESESEPKLAIQNITKRLTSMGYTMEDVVLAHLGGSFCQIVKGAQHHSDEFFDKIDQTLDDILDGKIAGDFRDTRTFAQVVAGIQV